MNIKRVAEKGLDDLLNSRKVGIILGARQVGKTTLAQHRLKGENALFLNFDVDVDKRCFLAASSLTPQDALKSFNQPDILVLDEAQRLPETARIIKGWYDAGVPTQFLLLGSSSLNLLNQAAESLTGRNQKLMLPPLLFEEILSTQSWYSPTYSHDDLSREFSASLRTVLLSCMAFGSYPEIVTTNRKTDLLRNLSSDYLWKDVLQTGRVKTPDLIKHLLVLLAHQVGSEVSVWDTGIRFSNGLNGSLISTGHATFLPHRARNYRRRRFHRRQPPDAVLPDLHPGRDRQANGGSGSRGKGSRSEGYDSRTTNRRGTG